MTSIRVLLVDDHDLFRRGLAEVLEDEPDIEVVAQAADGNRAVEAAARLLPDVVFMDLNMAGQSGIETTAYITQRWPDMKVLVLTVSEEISDLSRALSGGRPRLRSQDREPPGDHRRPAPGPPWVGDGVARHGTQISEGAHAAGGR